MSKELFQELVNDPKKWSQKFCSIAVARGFDPRKAADVDFLARWFDGFLDALIDSDIASYESTESRAKRGRGRPAITDRKHAQSKRKIEDELLRELWPTSLTDKEISDRINGYDRSVIRRRAQRLGLKTRRMARTRKIDSRADE